MKELAISFLYIYALNNVPPFLSETNLHIFTATHPPFSYGEEGNPLFHHFPSENYGPLSNYMPWKLERSMALFFFFGEKRSMALLAWKEGSDQIKYNISVPI